MFTERMRHKLARRGGIPWGSLGLLLVTVAISQGQQYRDSNFECTEAGYHPDPISCTVYYQCVNWGDASPLTKFKFECGPGTVFSHSKGDICVHPYESERSECSESANDLDSERYEPQSSSSPSYETRPPASSYPDYPTYGSPLPGTSSSGVSSPTVAVLESTTGGYYDNAGYPGLPSTNYPDSPTSDIASNSDCQQEGFKPHNECHKFIRCVSKGDHSYQSYEFTCGEGTVWDQTIEACNHPWAVSRSDCRVGGGQGSNEPGTDQSESNELPHPPGYPSTSGPAYPSYPSQQPQGPSGEESQGYPSSSGASYPSYPSQQPQGPSREEPEGYPSTSGPSYPSYPTQQSTTPDSLYPPPRPEVPSMLPVNPTESPDQSTNEPQQPPSGLYPPPSPPSPSHETGNELRPDASGDCKEEGFFADPNDCKKFFRCVGGEGIYQKHEFTCGEGTAWDQSLLTCNHEYAVPGCGSEAPHGGSNTESSSNEVTGHDKDQTPSGVTASLSPTSTSLQPEESSTTELTESTTQSLSSAASESTTTSTETSSSETDTSTEGLPSSESTTPSDISSPENTTPSEISSSESTTTSELPPSESTTTSESSSAETTTTTSSAESSTSPSDIATSPAETSPATDKPETENPDETSESSPSKPSSGKCEAEGFFADPDDCHKFFRCVSFESSSFTKFKFDCGPGTAWDQNLQTCNYEDQVESCEASGSPDEATNEVDSTQEPSQEPTPSTEAESSSPTESTPEENSPVTESSSSSSESTESTSEETSEAPEQSSTEASQTSSSQPDESSTSSSESSSGSSSESSTPPMPTTIADKPQSGKFKCKEEGFFPNPQDCHKFIRCVKVNQGFIKYNFDCGPGTAWDQNLLTCNYEDQVESCEEGLGESESTPQEPSSSSESTESGEAPETTEESTTPGETGEPTEPEATTIGGEETTPSEGGEETTTVGGEETTPGVGEETTEPSQPEETTTELPGTTTMSLEPEETTPSESEETTPNPSEPEETTPSEVEETTPTNPDETTEGEQTTSIEIETTAEISATPPPGSIVTPCPIGNLTDEQIVLVCPTGFKRHPKYCNMFYQCTSENHMEVKILVLACPENLVFDESKIQCLSEEETEQKCDTERASSRFYRKLEDSPVAPVRVTRSSLCPGEGHYPYEEGCSETFYKCQRDSRNDLQGFLYKCPENFVYWSVSRRCERASRLPTCFADNDDNNERKRFWERRKNLPIEKTNLSARSLQL